jgi:predicted amidophosphoribosyltransferase
MNRQDAIRILGEIKLCSPLGQAAHVALAALREKAEREKGCAFCNTGAHRILQNALYCPRCGKRLEVEHEN